MKRRCSHSTQSINKYRALRGARGATLAESRSFREVSKIPPRQIYSRDRYAVLRIFCQSSTVLVSDIRHRRGRCLGALASRNNRARARVRVE